MSHVFSRLKHVGTELSRAVAVSESCRQCRPDLSYPVSQMMSSVSGGSVADLRAANKAAELSGPVTLD